MKLLSLACLAAVSAVPSFGQVAEFSFHYGRSLLSDKDIGQGYSLDDGFRFGFRTTLNNWMFFGHEFGYAYNRTNISQNGRKLTDNTGREFSGMAIHQGFYNFLAYATPEGSRVRPFGAAGGHFSNFVPPGSSVTQGGGSTKYGVNYGGGVKFRILDRWGLRLDLRQYLNGKPFGLGDGKFRQNEISVGFGLVL